MKESVNFQGQEVIQIKNGKSIARFCPQHGGRLLSWDVREVPVIYWPENADWSKPAKIRGGNPLLFPFIARHMVDGEIGKWKHPSGEVLDLPMHGFARDAFFEVLPESTENSVSMKLSSSDETQKGYPYSFEFITTYTVLENELVSTLETINTGDQALPYYAGHHFYFAIPANERSSWELNLPCQKWARQNEDGSMAFSDPEEIKDKKVLLNQDDLVDRMHLLDQSSAPSPISVKNAEKSREIQFQLNHKDSLPWYAVTTWTQTEDSDFYCVEPWLGLPNAIHHEHGIRWIEPGKSESATCSIILNQ